MDSISIGNYLGKPKHHFRFAKLANYRKRRFMTVNIISALPLIAQFGETLATGKYFCAEEI